ncbi:MAG: Mrp/NBP35 family ATP-binding protein [Alphaproteobacteria bacterium]|nr:Mrp/NBP35 family ATP-binding protein [Alphaproteobacteria bacterium]
MSLESEVITVLKKLVDPLTHQDIVSAGILQGLQVSSSGKVTFILEISTAYMQQGLKLKEDAAALLKSLAEVKDIQITLTAQRKPKGQNQPKEGIRGVNYIIAIASGKGGVGKSTTAVNLAYGLQNMGLRIGILDGDVYGPSLPRLLGVSQKPTSDDGRIINPIVVNDLKCMSMGFMIDEKVPAVWRGPMIQNAFHQMLRQVSWGELDVLVVDLPPGTGDVQLTLAQSVLLSGAIIISTPQDLALIDARKGLEMFLKVSVPILGWVENMSYYLCPHCEGRSDIFEHGGVRKEAHALGIPFLAEIPLHMSIREASEKGMPIVKASPYSEEASVYKALAQKTWELLTKLS